VGQHEIAPPTSAVVVAVVRHSRMSTWCGKASGSFSSSRRCRPIARWSSRLRTLRRLETQNGPADLSLGPFNHRLPERCDRLVEQRPFMIEHRTEIAHIKPAAAGFAFPKMIGVAQRRATDLLADDFSARDRRRHARNLGQAFLASPSTP
jgi:hypothetical protein